MGNSDDAVTFTLLRGSQHLKVNRLTPKVSVPSDVAVYSQAANDAVSFTLTCSGDGGSVSNTISYRTWGSWHLQLN